jgi:adenylate kinase
LDSQNLYDDIIFDGFPRSIGQYIFLKNWFKEKGVKIDLGIVLTISEVETLKRLTARRLDPSTGKIYNLITEPPPVGVNRQDLIQRDDDKPEAIKRRLDLYKKVTEPLVSELRKDTRVVEVNGARPIEVIAKDLEDLIRKSQNND